MQLNTIAKAILADYVPPPMDEGIREELCALSGQSAPCLTLH